MTNMKGIKTALYCCLLLGYNLQWYVKKNSVTEKHEFYRGPLAKRNPTKIATSD